MTWSEHGDFVRGLDHWIEGDVNTGSGNKHPCVLKCVSCDWSGEFSPAMQHFRETGHDLTYRGRIQDLANLVRR